MGLHEPPRYINMKNNPYNETWMDGALGSKDSENFDQDIYILANLWNRPL